MSQQGAERAWWWKVAMHLDEAQFAIHNVLVHNVDDPTPVHMLHGKLREAQTFLLEIFRWKGILPGHVPSAPGASAVAGVPGYPGVAVPVPPAVAAGPTVGPSSHAVAAGPGSSAPGAPQPEYKVEVPGSSHPEYK